MVPSSATAAAPSGALLSQARITIAGAGTGGLAGTSVADAGDVNGDGIDDLAVGAYLAGTDRQGSVYVIFGGRSQRRIDLRHLGAQGFEIRGAQSWGYAGFSVAGGRDVNGDGLADLVIGVPRVGVTRSSYGGAAFVVFGKRDTAPVSLGALGSGGFEIRGDWLGRSVALAPDMNGDGRAEVVLGAGHDFGWGGSDAAAYVVFGTSASDPVDVSALGPSGFEVDDRHMNAWTVVAGLADVNGDGRGDLVVGVPSENYPPGPGVAYVVFGSGDGSAVDAEHLGGRGIAIRGSDPGDKVAAAVADAGDTNGDGLHDVLIGAPETNDAHGIEAGAAYVVYGSRTPHDEAVGNLGADGFTVTGARGGDAVLRGGEQLGFSVASAGDVNGDGRADLLLGAPFAGGAAYVVPSPPGPATLDLARRGTARRLAGARQLDEFGRAVAAGRFDGTNGPMAAVGAPYSAPAGAAFVLPLGSGASAAARPPRRPASEGTADTLGPLRASYLFDGTHWAVIGDLVPGVMRVYDTRTGRSFDQRVDPGCQPTGAGNGLVVVSCDEPRSPDPQFDSFLQPHASRPFVYRIGARSLVPAAGDTSTDNEVDSWYAVGRQWIAGGLSCYHCTTLYRNWHTGATFEGPADIDPEECFDLDSPSQRSIPCPAPDVVGTEHGYTLRIRGRFATPPTTDHSLVLEHRQRVLRLSRCAQPCGPASLGGGRVVWVEGTTVHGYVIATRRRVTWHLPKPFVIGLGFSLAQLGPEAIVSVADNTSVFTAPVGPPEAYRLRWPST